MRKYLGLTGLSLALLSLGGAGLVYALGRLTGPADWRLAGAGGLAALALLNGAAAGWLFYPAWPRAGLLAGAGLSLPLIVLMAAAAPGVFTLPVLAAPLVLTLVPALAAALLSVRLLRLRSRRRQAQAQPAEEAGEDA